jgi:acid phosphatase (class A)
MTPRRFLLAATLAGLLAAPGLAAPACAAEPPYLTAAMVDLSTLLPPPPPLDSALQRSEVEQVIAAQQAASPERIALAVADANETVFDMFTRTLGPRFTPAAAPKATALFTRVTDSEDDVVDPAKKTFGRLRPFLADPRIKALVPASKSGSWPSGHTTRVTMTAAVLAAMLPERRAEIWARAHEYAESRVIGGMHYPLDLDAGERAGSAMAAVLFNDPAFRADFGPARAELRAALGM